ncbi:RNA-directed DNA polymerase, eukaryota [Tanacetum coccineum]
MDNSGRNNVVYSLVQRDGNVRDMRHHEKRFWSDVFANFEKDMRGNIRGYDAIVVKWKNLIRLKVAVFSVVYDSVQRMDKNGSSDLVLFQNALAEFQTGYGHPFTMEAFWRILKNHAVWTEFEIPTYQRRGSSSQQHTHQPIWISHLQQEHQLRLDEEALRETLKEEANAEKEWEERIKKEQAEYELFSLWDGGGRFIPNRRSKAGKHFAFVRFIKVDNVDRLVRNLCTLWIGRMHLHANVVRFERSPLHFSRSSQPIRPDKPAASSFVSALKGIPVTPLPAPSTPAMVLDESCMVTRDLDNYVMGEVKQFSSINNLRVLLSNEGFHNTQLVYLGGLWVMIELESIKTKTKFMKHVGVASWFNRLCNAQSDFVSKERIIWVDIEGVPLHAWSRNTFYKIGSKWGEVLELEECKDDFFARKRICIKTKQEDNILEKFKIIVNGKIFVARAKELFVWSPTFKDVPEVVYCSDDEFVTGVDVNNAEINKQTNLEAESDNEAVSETYFGEHADELGNENDSVQPSNEKEISNDPFNIYDLLNKRDKDVGISGMDTSIPYPPGFTPEKVTHNEAEQEVHGADHILSHSRSEGCSSRILEDAQKIDEHFSTEVRGNGVKHKEGGSILEILDEMIKSSSLALGGIILNHLETNAYDYMIKGF